MTTETTPTAPDVPDSDISKSGTTVLKGALALLSTQPITWAASLAMTVAVPHFLGSARLGEYSVALSVVGFVGLVAGLGVPNQLVRRVAAHPDGAQPEFGAALIIEVSIAIVASMILVIVMPGRRFPVSRGVLGLALAGMVVGSAQAIFYAMLVGRERHRFFAWFNALASFGGAGAGVAVLLAGGTIEALLATSLMVQAVGFALIWTITRYQVPRAAFDVGLWRRLIVAGLPFVGWDLAQKAYGDIDKLILAFLSTTTVVGWYSAAISIAAIPVFVPTVVTTPLYPALSRLSDKPDELIGLLRRATGAVLMLTIPASTGIAVLSPVIPHLLHWPPDFEHSVPLIAILAFQLPLVGLGMVFGTGLLALRRERPKLIIAMVAAGFNPALNFALIPAFQRLTGNGAIASAVVTDATDLLIVIGAASLLPRGVIGFETASLMVRTLAAAGCVAVVASALRPFSIPLSVSAGVLVYCAAGIALRIVSIAEIRALWTTIVRPDWPSSGPSMKRVGVD